MQSCVDHESSSWSDLIVDCCTQYKVMLSNFFIIIIIIKSFWIYYHWPVQRDTGYIKKL